MVGNALQEATYGRELRRSWSQRAGSPIHRLLTAQDGSLAAISDASVLIYSARSPYGLKQQLRLPGAPRIGAACFAARNGEFITCSADGFLRIWKIDSGEEACCTPLPAASLPAGGDAAAALAAAAAVTELACCSATKNIAAASGRCGRVAAAAAEAKRT